MLIRLTHYISVIVNLGCRIKSSKLRRSPREASTKHRTNYTIRTNYNSIYDQFVSDVRGSGLGLGIRFL